MLLRGLFCFLPCGLTPFLGVEFPNKYYAVKGMNVFSSEFSGLTCLLGYICRITVNFGTLKNGSLLINIFLKQLF